MIKYVEGNMFDHEHDCYVNTINCVGAMGAGIALEFKNQYPKMFEEYQRLCFEKQLAPGDCWVYPLGGGKFLANLAVKNHFKNRIRLVWAKIAIRNLVNRILWSKLPVQSVALPRIGSKNGGRGKPLTEWDDNWPEDSEMGYVKGLEPFLLAELAKCPKVEFTIYKL